jgi:heat shock protein HtpX
VSLAASASVCPGCGSELARPDRGQPWCPACEWNLGVYDPEVVPSRGWRWLDRRAHALAFRLDRALFAELSRERPTRPGWTLARVVLVAISALLVLLTLGCLGLGIWLVAQAFPSWPIVPGVLLILVAVGLRPRLGRRPPRKHVLRRDRAPALFALVDRVAAAVGTAPPQVIAVEPSFNAFMGRFGLRWRSALLLGVALWVTLPPPLRVVLLAHELAHTVNGDPAHGLLVQPALDTFRRLARATDSDRTIGEITMNDRPNLNFLRLVIEVLLWAVSRVFLLVHLGLLALGMRDHQRAEYLADAVSVDVAGTEAVADMLDRMVLLPSITTLIRYNAPTVRPEAWRKLADSFHASRTGQLPFLRQLTARSTSLWDSHPPAGMRARMVRAWPAREPSVVVGQEESARIDAELAGWYAATHRLILGTREFDGR